MTFTTTSYGAASSVLPADATWSASFGNPGCGGYVELFRTPRGERFTISNGRYDDVAPFAWTVVKEDAA
jgi:hypothetical protein